MGKKKKKGQENSDKKARRGLARGFDSFKDNDASDSASAIVGRITGRVKAEGEEGVKREIVEEIVAPPVLSEGDSSGAEEGKTVEGAEKLEEGKDVFGEGAEAVEAEEVNKEEKDNSTGAPPGKDREESMRELIAGLEGDAAYFASFFQDRDWKVRKAALKAAMKLNLKLPTELLEMLRADESGEVVELAGKYSG